MFRERTGAGLVVGGAALLVVTMVLSAALAPAIGAVDDAGEERRTLVGSQGGGPGLHEHGRVYLLDGRRTVWSEGSANSYFDVTRLDNGSVAAGFMSGPYRECGSYEPPCSRTGFRILDPDADGGDAEVLAEFSFPVRSKANSEVHDVEPLPGGGWLISDMEHERIAVVEDGAVVWSWNASTFYDAPADPTRADWLHINDVDRLGDGRYLVSVRNANQLLVVERRGSGGEVVEVINEDDSPANDGNCKRGNQLRDADGDGDVRCGDPEVLDHQHNPQWLGDGTVLVADSDNGRVVELHRDGASGEWEVAWTVDSAAGVELSWPRDADRLENGNTLITDSLNERLVEVNENGTVVWSYKTRYVPYEAERLPEGERVGAAAYGSSGAADGGDSGATDGIPVLSFATQALHTVYPLPFWFSELHLLVAVVSLAMVVGGAGLLVVERLRGVRGGDSGRL